MSRFDRFSLLATHSLSRYRRDIVSFGGLVYFLRSAYEYGALTGESRPGRLFQHGVRAMLGIQGPQGQWPWQPDAPQGFHDHQIILTESGLPESWTPGVTGP